MIMLHDILIRGVFSRNFRFDAVILLTTTTATGADSDTILQDVVLLWSPTGWPLSLIVLFASIMIPSAKIVALAISVLSMSSTLAGANRLPPPLRSARG